MEGSKMLLTPAKDSVDVLIFVSSINKSLGFYEGALGLEKTKEVETPFGTVHWLRYGTSAVKLMEPSRCRRRAMSAGEATRHPHLSFEIRNLSGVCSVLQGKGVEFVMPETQVLPGRHIAMVKDPDGNIIESNRPIQSTHWANCVVSAGGTHTRECLLAAEKSGSFALRKSVTAQPAP